MDCIIEYKVSPTEKRYLSGTAELFTKYSEIFYRQALRSGNWGDMSTTEQTNALCNYYVANSGSAELTPAWMHANNLKASDGFDLCKFVTIITENSEVCAVCNGNMQKWDLITKMMKNCQECGGEGITYREIGN